MKSLKYPSSSSISVVKNDETGAEIYQCLVCSSKYGTKKAMKTHNTTKHKTKKKEETPKEDEIASEFDFSEEPGFVPSTQKETPMSVEDIAKLYEPGNNEFLDSVEHEDDMEDNKEGDKDIEKDSGKEDTDEVQHVETIPDDTVDKIITDISNGKTVDDLFTENVLLKSKLNSAEKMVKEKEQNILELETSLIDEKTEITKMKDEMKVKDEQSELLIGEKNALEENVANLNGIIQKMYLERTIM